MNGLQRLSKTRCYEIHQGKHSGFVIALFAWIAHRRLEGLQFLTGSFTRMSYNTKIFLKVDIFSALFRSGFALDAPRCSASRKRGFRAAIQGLLALILTAFGAIPVNVALQRLPPFSLARTKKASKNLSPFNQILV